jgi:DNA primase
LIPDHFKQDLLNRVDIVDLIERYVPLRKGGSNYVACCPFHNEKSPSFTVSPTKQFYHCFGCGAHGDAIGFLMEYSGLGYIDAIKDLADTAGMKVPESESRSKKPQAGPDLHEMMQQAAQYYRDQLKASPAAIEYLKGRGLTGKVAAHFGIGYAPSGWQNLQAVFPQYQDRSLLDCGLVIENDSGKRYDRFRDRIMFPILNQRGAVIAFGGRVLERNDGSDANAAREPAKEWAKDGGGPKYLNSPETPLFEKGQELYGLAQARMPLRAAGRAVVVEGYMDVVALAQHGIEYAVATLGTATSATHVQKLFRQTDEIVFCFDGDAAGRRAAWHALEVSLPLVPDHKKVRFLFLPQEHDPDSYVREHGKEAFEALLGSAMLLSAYLVDELRGRVQMDTSEGRSRLIHEAKPLLKRLTAPVLQLQLLQRFAELAGLTQQDAARMLEIRSSAGSFVKQQRAPARVERPLAQSFERWLLKRLMVNPALGRHLPVEHLDPAHADTPGVLAIIEYARNSPHPNSEALLIDHFRGSELETLFNQVRSELIVLNLTPEQAEAEFLDALPNLERRCINERLTRLRQRAAEGSITTGEMADMNELLKRLSALGRPA